MSDRGGTLTMPAPVLAPHGLYVTGDDHLLVTTIGSVANLDVVVSGRLLDETGRPVPFREAQRTNSDRTTKQSTIRLARGWLTDVTTIAATAAPLFGQSFVRVDLIRGDGPGATVLSTLIQGMVTGAQRLAWPGSPIGQTINAPGAPRSVLGADPAAGAEISETVPTGARWRVQSIRAALVTDATAANREVAITFDDGATVYAEAHSGVNHAASLTRQYTAARGGVRGAAASGTGILIAISDLVLPAGHRIRTSTTNLQAGDNFGAPQLLVEEWLEGA